MATTTAFLGASATHAVLASRISDRSFSSRSTGGAISPRHTTLSPRRRRSIVVARSSATSASAASAAPASSASPDTADSSSENSSRPVLLTCRQCKQPFDPALNHPSACSFHPAHYGGEVKRKWKSYSYHQVGKQFLYHSEETRAEWGEVENFWDCCGRNDPMDAGCTVGPHRSYDDA